MKVGPMARVVMLVVTVFAGSGALDAMGSAAHYDLYLRLDPARQSIEVSGSFEWPAGDCGEPMVLYLHKDMTVIRVVGGGLRSWVRHGFRPSPFFWMPDGRALILNFTNEGHEGSRRRVFFAYRGRITHWNEWSANVLTPEWTELGVYLPWFPTHPDCGPFTFHLEVERVAGIEIRSTGEAKQDGGRLVFEGQDPTSDIVVAASPGLKTRGFETPGCQVWVHHVTLSTPTVEQIADDVSWIFGRFRSWFSGSVRGRITLLQSMRERGGGYARRGFISLGGLDDEGYRGNREGYQRYLSHELSHLWWHRAPTSTWEDWLNEGFAEYSALLVIRERFGEEAFQRRLHEKRENSKGLPPVRCLNRQDVSSADKRNVIERVLYQKAPVLLHRLREKIGYGRFIEACRLMIERNVQSTAGFLRTLDETVGPGTGEWFGSLLDR